MAALQTIRDKAGILVSIIVGVALLAFVVGDALSSSSSILSSRRNNVGEIEGQNISILTYQAKINERENAYKMSSGAALSDSDLNQLREQVWNEMIYTTILEEQADKIGISVSEDELYDMTYGNAISPLIYNMFGTTNVAEIRYIIQYMIQNPQYGMNWAEIQNQVRTNRLYEKYSLLVADMFHTTSLELADGLTNQSVKYDISYLTQRYTTYADSTITVSDVAMREYYNEHPTLQNETREITYVSFDIIPTEEDRDAILEEMENLNEQLAVTTTPENLIGLNAYTKTIPLYYTKDEITNKEMADYIFAGNSGVFGPYEEENFFKISRGLEKKSLPDSVHVRHILIPATSQEEGLAMADSLLRQIKSGSSTFEQMASLYSADNNTSQAGGDLGWMKTSTLLPELTEAFGEAKLHTPDIVSSNYGVQIYEVLERTHPETMIKIATIDKEIRPSAATEIAATNLAREFANGVTTSEELIDKAQEQKLSRRTAILDKNDYMVNNMEDSRQLVQQAYLEKAAGKVLSNRDNSTVFSFSNTRRVIAALTQINDEGPIPFSDREIQIHQILVNKEKGKKIAEELSEIIARSESMEDIAAETGLELRNATDITFASVQIPGAGIEPLVIGAIPTLKVGEISEPILGNQGVFLVMVNDREEEEITPEDEFSEIYRSQYMLNVKLTQQLLPTLAKLAKVKDYRYKFY